MQILARDMEPMSDTVEREVNAALEKLFALEPDVSLSLVRVVAAQLAAHVADVGVLADTCELRASARHHMYHLRTEVDELLSQMRHVPRSHEQRH